jgi:hypothetical protein
MVSEKERQKKQNIFAVEKMQSNAQALHKIRQ